MSLLCSSMRALVPTVAQQRLFPQDRLLGLLMPFRAFGDVKFKWSIELQKRVLESGPDQLHENEHTKFIPPNYHTPPYLTAEPEITHHKLRPQDRFLVSGSMHPDVTTRRRPPTTSTSVSLLMGPKNNIVQHTLNDLIYRVSITSKIPFDI